MRAAVVRTSQRWQVEATGLKMTRDELLSKIKEEEQKPFDVDSGGWTALKAVVELHSPDDYSGKTCKAHEECWGCGEWGHTDECDCRAYPCSTIQAIVKELA